MQEISKPSTYHTYGYSFQCLTVEKDITKSHWFTSYLRIKIQNLPNTKKEQLSDFI